MVESSLFHASGRRVVKSSGETELYSLARLEDLQTRRLETDDLNSSGGFVQGAQRDAADEYAHGDRADCRNDEADAYVNASEPGMMPNSVIAT